MNTAERPVILFPSSRFSDEVEEDKLDEYKAACNTEVFRVTVFSYKEWFREGRLSLDSTPEGTPVALYRGMAMRPEKYARFYASLAEKGIRLITSPEEYERFQVFTNIYPLLKEDTPEAASFAECREQLELKVYEDHTNEFRVFYIGGRAYIISRNSAQAGYVQAPPRRIIEKYENLKSPFYTIDYAELEDGSWKVIGAADGQVSALSSEQNPYIIFRLLYVLLSENEK